MWFILLIFSNLIFLFSGDPLLAITLPCIVQGFPAAQTAVWLRWWDSNVQRGQTCFWFYLAAAGWISAMTAFLHLLSFLVVAFTTGEEPELHTFTHTMLALLGGLFVSTLLGLRGVRLALRYELRVFVLPRLFRKCGGDFSSIGEVISSRDYWNYGTYVLASSLFVPIIAIGGILSALGAGGEGVREANSLLANVGLFVVIVGPIAAIALYAALSRRVIARSAEECWPAGENQ